MKHKLTGILVFGISLFKVSFAASEMVAGDLVDLYNKAATVIGANERKMLATGDLRFIVWKANATQELMLVPVMELHKNREHHISSFLGYSLTEKKMSSTKIYQCSWREVRRPGYFDVSELKGGPARNADGQKLIYHQGEAVHVTHTIGDQKILYECGTAMNLPNGLEEMPSAQMVRNFQTLVNAEASRHRETNLARSQD